MLEHFRSQWKQCITPIARWCIALGISANAVTIVGTIATVVIAFVAAITGQLALGALLVTIVVLFDSLDGLVAKLTNTATPFGAFLDSTLDRIADWAILASALLYYFQQLLWNISYITPAHSIVHQWEYWACVRQGGGNIVCAMQAYPWHIVGIIAIVVAMMTSFVTSYARARGQSLGTDPTIGVATRADRLFIILIGQFLVGVGFPLFVWSMLLIMLAVLGCVTVGQRIRAVSTMLNA